MTDALSQLGLCPGEELKQPVVSLLSPAPRAVTVILIRDKSATGFDLALRHHGTGPGYRPRHREIRGQVGH